MASPRVDFKLKTELKALERLKLIVAYDGTPFKGWQSQTGGNTVQDHIEAAFAKICGGRIAIHGSGRTDAGVHATGQCAHADVPNGTLPPAKWLAALNANLPREIRIVKSSRAPREFHARFSAKGKIYTYRICNAPVQSPFEIHRSWHLPGELDLAALKAVAKKLTGTHDFAAFAANRGKPNEDTVRTLRRIEVRRSGGLVTIIFEGSGFLYRMARLLTGSMVRCAQHRAEPGWIDELLAGARKTSFAAPAEGLYLTRVLYQGLS
jgi:tRNA pseudouridine38-40 synthase